jgi:hypothetical protein
MSGCFEGSNFKIKKTEPGIAGHRAYVVEGAVKDILNTTQFLNPEDLDKLKTYKFFGEASLTLETKAVNGKNVSVLDAICANPSIQAARKAGYSILQRP